MRNIKITIIAVLTLLVSVSKGQTSNSLYYMDNLPQASKLNPARMPNCNFYINIPNVAFKTITDIEPGLFITRDNVVNDTLRMPYYNEDLWNNFMDKLDDPISLMLETEVGLGFGFRAGRGYWHFDLSERNNISINLAKDLLTFNNLGQGERKDFSTMSLNATAFLQAGIGYAREINQNLSVGGKIKLLKGVVNGQMVINKGDFFTSVEYWQVGANAEANLSFPIEFETDEEGNIIGVNDSALKNIDVNYLRKIAPPSVNFGTAIDLGVEYKLLPKLQLSASIIDFGKIWWNNDVKNITAKGDVKFDGIKDPDNAYFLDDEDERGQFFEEFGDSLLNLFSTPLTYNNYSTNLAPKLYIGAEYLLNDVFSVGVLSNTTFYRKKTMQSIMFSANANFYHFLTAGAHYGWNWGYANTGGFTFGFNIWPIQIYMSADYIPLRYQPVDTGEELNLGFITQKHVPVPVNFNALNFQLGMNLKFGCRKKYNIPVYDREYDSTIPGQRSF